MKFIEHCYYLPERFMSNGVSGVYLKDKRLEVADIIKHYNANITSAYRGNRTQYNKWWVLVTYYAELCNVLNNLPYRISTGQIQRIFASCFSPW